MEFPLFTECYLPLSSRLTQTNGKSITWHGSKGAKLLLGKTWKQQTTLRGVKGVDGRKILISIKVDFKIIWFESGQWIQLICGNQRELMYRHQHIYKFLFACPLPQVCLAALFMEADKNHLMFWCTLWNIRHAEIRNRRNLYKMYYVNLHEEF